jgi:photosystem II stability/assembly factor-like uncharacterized protein
MVLFMNKNSDYIPGSLIEKWHEIKMKQVLRFLMVRMVIVLTFGKAVVGFTLFAVAYVPVSASTPAGTIPLISGWIQTNWTASNSFFNLYACQDKIFARTWDSFNGGCMFLTTDEGANWTQISSADSDIDILSIVMLNSNILAGTWNGFYLSTNGDTTWNAVTPAGIPADIAIWSIVMIDTTLFAGTTGNIYKSLDNGNTWTEVNSGIPVDARINSIVASGDAIIAGSASNGIFKTTNGGASWTEINSGLTNTYISQLMVMDTKLFAVTLEGVFESDNNGMSWAAGTSGLENVNCIVVVNDQLLAGTDDNGIYLSDDGGVTWISFSSGIPGTTRVWSLAVSSDCIFAGTDKGVWRLPLSEIITEVKNIAELPKDFSLEQNYPNPFNPSTKIKYSIPSVGTRRGVFVQLKVYDVLGNKVATLVNEEKPAGTYEVTWNASDLPSGVYFYRIQAGSFVETKKMTLLK